MIISGEKLRNLQLTELNMLREFVRVCQELNLRYYLLGGTLLGAIRHKGFIPWDDDIDVGMPRADYEVFLEQAQDRLPDNLFVQCRKTDPEYPMCFAKIRNNDTTFIETSINHFKIHHGVYIDVFPLDWYPEKEAEIAVLDWKKKLYMRRIGCEFNSQDKTRLKTRMIDIVLKCMLPNVANVMTKRDHLFVATPPSAYLVNHGGAWGKKEIVPADWYGEGVPVEFEGITVNAPCKYENWLTQVYGNYMQLPPVEKRIGHHYADVIDLNIPYRKFADKSKR